MCAGGGACSRVMRWRGRRGSSLKDELVDDVASPEELSGPTDEVGDEQKDVLFRLCLSVCRVVDSCRYSWW